MKNYLKQTTFLAIISCLLWSSAFVGIKIGLQYHTPLQFAGIRFLLSGLILLPLIAGFRFWKEVRANFPFICLVAFLQVILQYTFFYMGIKLEPASISAMIVGSSPLFVALVAHFSFETDRLNPTKIVSIFLGISGVAVIAFGRKSLPSGAEITILGVVLLIMNNITSGISNVVIAKNRNSVSPLVLTSSSLIIGGLGMMFISLPVEGLPEHRFPPSYFAALAWLSFLSATAITIWNTLLQRSDVKVSELNIWKFLIPVSGAILSWLILPNESPDLISVLGMCLIGTSLVVLSLLQRKN